MVTGYKALLALAEIQTKSLDSTVQKLLARKKQRRKQQEEQDRQRQELEVKLRLRYFDEQKKKKDAEARETEGIKAQEADLRRREAARRDAMRYGPKKTKTAHAVVRRKSLPDEEALDKVSVLTRQEKRERKRDAEQKRIFASPRRSSRASTNLNPRHLPPRNKYDPNALGVTSGLRNVKERLAAAPDTLTRLNVIKRDTRTIDEIVRDRRGNREVLHGDRARGFDDWFAPSNRFQVTNKANGAFLSEPISKEPPPAPQLQHGPGSANGSKKRPRSLSISYPDNRTPKRACPARVPCPPSSSTLSEQIWGLFGKNKAAYSACDWRSDSDGEDVGMEASAGAVEREEGISERIARREEREADAEERRHREEKHRRGVVVNCH
ncbi:hypothetical protein B0H11DRAFT_2232245 [Mycena galericulata]|nr:hypothetical protein B0H11DRAFT_2232245 [Mycena galericulata]